MDELFTGCHVISAHSLFLGVNSVANQTEGVDRFTMKTRGSCLEHNKGVCGLFCIPMAVFGSPCNKRFSFLVALT